MQRIVVGIGSVMLLWVAGVAQITESVKTMPVVIRDFNSSHPDFENSACRGGVGMVQPTLGPDGKPFNTPANVCPEADIRGWFTDGPDNTRYCTDLPFTPVSGNDHFYQHKNPLFFPIDDVPTSENTFRDTDTKQIRNFHFCMEMHSSFQYRGGEVFEFTGDDDIWVFINKKLAVDIGGIHPALQGSVNLDEKRTELGIEVGKHYDLDFFYCERKTGRSQFHLTTSIDLVPPEPPRLHIGNATGDPYPAGSTVTVDGATGVAVFTGMATRKVRESKDCNTTEVEKSGLTEGNWTFAGQTLPKSNRAEIDPSLFPEGVHELVFTTDGQQASQLVLIKWIPSRAITGYYQDRDGDGRIETAVLHFDANFKAAPASITFTDPFAPKTALTPLSAETSGQVVTFSLPPFAPGTGFPADSLASILAQAGFFEAHRAVMHDSVGPVAITATTHPSTRPYSPSVLEVRFSEGVTLAPNLFPFEIIRAGVPIPANEIILVDVTLLAPGRYGFTFAPGSKYPVPGDSLRVLDAAAQDPHGTPSRMRTYIPIGGEPARLEAKVEVELQKPYVNGPHFTTRPLANPVVFHGGGTCINCAEPRFAGLTPILDPATLPTWGPTWTINTEFPFRYNFFFYDNLGQYINQAQGEILADALQSIRNATNSGDTVSLSMTFLPVSSGGRLLGTGAYIARGWVETAGELTVGAQGEPVHMVPDRKLVLLRFGYVRKE